MLSVRNLWKPQMNLLSPSSRCMSVEDGSSCIFQNINAILAGYMVPISQKTLHILINMKVVDILYSCSSTVQVGNIFKWLPVSRLLVILALWHDHTFGFICIYFLDQFLCLPVKLFLHSFVSIQNFSPYLALQYSN